MIYALIATVFGFGAGFVAGTTWPMHPLNQDMKKMGLLLALILTLPVGLALGAMARA